MGMERISAMRIPSVALVASVAIVACALFLSRQIQPRNTANATGVGPTITVGAPTLSSGKVQLPLSATGSGFDPYSGFNIHLRWDASIFKFDSANDTGTVINSPFCPAPAVDGDNAGVIYACTATSTPTTTGGLLATIVLTPVSVGCSALHLFTLGPPDGGDTTTGTYTIDPSDFTPQTNTLSDGAANNLGASCTPPGPATSTPTASDTVTVTQTPTVTATPTSTPTVLSGQPDVTISASGPSNVDSGVGFSINVVASNVGQTTATGVSVDIIPPLGGVLLLNGYCHVFASGHLSCALPNLTAGGSVNFALSEQAPIVTASGHATTSLHTSAANEPGPNTGNNDGAQNVSVRGCPDLNGDGQVNILDFDIAAKSFGLIKGQPGYNALADQNGDNVINVLDLSLMTPRFLDNCKGFDSDHDGLTDHDEQQVYHTNVSNPDTDGDGLPDGVEVLTFGSDPLAPDTSQDGYTDGEKAALGKNPVLYCPIMRGDVDHSGVLNILDFSAVATYFHQSVPPAPQRLDQGPPPFDNVINILDFSKMATWYQHNIAECT